MKESGLEKIIFVCTDSTETFFSKLRSAGLNYNLPIFFFTVSYCAGLSNKHCLLTFFFCIRTAKVPQTLFVVGILFSRCACVCASVCASVRHVLFP